MNTGSYDLEETMHRNNYVVTKSTLLERRIKLAKDLNLPLDGEWEITDYRENIGIYLITPKSGYEDRYEGMIYDLINKKRFILSYLRTPDTIAHEIGMNEGRIHTSISHSVPPTKPFRRTFYPSYVEDIELNHDSPPLPTSREASPSSNLKASRGGFDNDFVLPYIGRGRASFTSMYANREPPLNELIVREMNTHRILRFPYNEIDIKKDFGGIFLKVWRYQGRSYLSSDHSIDIRESWERASPSQPSIAVEESLPLNLLYQIAGGPNPDDFFPSEQQSDWVHILVLIHPDLLKVSRMIFEVGRLGRVLYFASIKQKSDINDSIIIPKGIELCASLNILQSNHFLRYGHHPIWNDYTLPPQKRSGESIIIIHKEKCYHIISPAMAWRRQLNSEAELILSFYKVTEYATTKSRYISNIPVLFWHDKTLLEGIIRQGQPILQLPVSPLPLHLHRYDQRLFGVWMCFLLIIPIHQQIHALEIYDHYLIASKKIIETIYRLYLTNNCRCPYVDLSFIFASINPKNDIKSQIFDHFILLSGEVRYNLITYFDSELN